MDKVYDHNAMVNDHYLKKYNHYNELNLVLAISIDLVSLLFSSTVFYVKYFFFQKSLHLSERQTCCKQHESLKFPV